MGENKKKLKVLLINENHYLKGGADKYFLKLKEELIKKNVNAYSLGFGEKAEEGENYKIIKENKSMFVRHFWRIFFNRSKYKEIKKYVEKINPDVIHLHCIGKYTLSLLRAIKKYNVVYTVQDYWIVDPTLLGIHNDLEVCEKGFGLKCLFKHKRDYNWIIYLSTILFFYRRNKLLKKMIDTFIVTSPKLGQYMERDGFKNIKFIPNFIDIKETNPEWDKINKNQILFIGMLEKNKGIHKFIDVMPIVVKRFPDVKLIIAGKGTLEKELKRKVRKYEIEKNIDFLGWVKGVDRLYTESAFVVLPSMCMDNSPVTIQEAMVNYRPSIGSNLGGIPWLIKNNETGFVFDLKDKPSLINHIERLLNDFDLVKTMGLNANKRIRKLMDKEKLIQQHIELYNESK